MLNPRAKLLWHGDRVKEWLETGRTKPILVEIAPTGYCNSNCPWCFFKGKNTGENIKTEKLVSALTELKELGAKAVNWTGGGEPTLHPDFDYLVTVTHDLGLKQGLFTNGYKEIAHPKCFEWIRISLTPKSFTAIKRPKAPFGICLNQLKEHTDFDLRTFCAAAKQFGASYFQIRPALIGNWETQPVLEIPDYLKEYETNDFKVELTPYKYEQAIQERKYKFCYGFHFCPALNWKGEFSVCMYFINDPRFILGNIYEDSIKDIFDRFKYVKVCGDCQQACKNDNINILLDEIVKVTEPDFL